MVILPSTYNTNPTFCNRHITILFFLPLGTNYTYTSFIPESENTRQTFCFLYRALSYIPHTNQQNALIETQLLLNLISAFCWFIYGARETILKLWTVGLQIKYVPYSSTSKETATETGGHVRLVTCTATQAWPLISVESTTKWSRATILILPHTGKTANKEGPLQFAVHVPKVLSWIHADSAALFSSTALGHPLQQSTTLPTPIRFGYADHTSKWCHQNNDYDKKCNKWSRYVPLFRKSNAPYANTNFSTSTVTPAYVFILGYVFILSRSLITSFASLSRPATTFNFLSRISRHIYWARRRHEDITKGTNKIGKVRAT